MKNELISVVIPTYGRYEELIRALNSVKKQTYRNLEVLIIDDNNDSKLSNSIKQLVREQYPDYIYIKNKKNLGGSGSRNIGIEESHGKYIAFLDDDDEYYPSKIEKQHNKFLEINDEKLALVYCYGDILYPNGTSEKERTCHRGNCLVEQMQANIAGTSFWLVKKEALIKVGRFKKIHSHQDGVVLLNLLANGYLVDLVEEDLMAYYFHAKGKGITDVNDKILQADEEYLKLCMNYFNKISKRNQKKVLLKYYNNRNWNLIILNKIAEAKKDIKILAKKFLLSKTLFICICRLIFRKHVFNKEKRFNEEVLLGDKK